MIISLDTECTGLDLAHSSRPFLVTTCDGDGVIRFWEWDVNPLTRMPNVPEDDLSDIAELIDVAELIYLQNSKYDVRALATIGLDLPWPKVRDTLIMGHLLGSNLGHSLDELCMDYLMVDIKPHETHVKKIVQECRAIAKRTNPDWKLADEGVEGMPSVKVSSNRDEDKPWKADMWLPRMMSTMLDGQLVNPEWEYACSKYANADSEHTLYLGLELERLIRERGYWNIYLHRLQLMRVDCEMESYGVTMSGERTSAMADEYEMHIAEAEAVLADMATGYGHDLKLAKGASVNDNMRDFIYGAVWRECSRCGYERRVKHWLGDVSNGLAVGESCPKCAKDTRYKQAVNVTLAICGRDNLHLPVISTKDVRASLDKDAMKEYLATQDGTAHDFIELLNDKRDFDTALTYIEQYRRFWVPTVVPDYYRVHSSINPCGTDHLRQSNNSPNLQNVSGENKRINLRACFGPTPKREWWDMDFKSIERRIPVYECREPKMLEVFEAPDKPPYWGSLYLLTASVLYPNEFWPCSKEDGKFRKDHPNLYKRAKFFDLARQYGAGLKKGDHLAGFTGASEKVAYEFPLFRALQAKYVGKAEELGYIETLPDRTVDPTRGYPILVGRSESGKMTFTTPFNYHVSGTACWCKNTALIRCADQCAEWRNEGFDAHVILEVHDELKFDFPRGMSVEENMPRAMVLRGLMEQSGEDLIPSIPTPVSVKYITENWADGIEV